MSDLFMSAVNKLLCISALILFPLATQAGFAIVGSQNSDQYGYAHTAPFERAIKGNTQNLTGIYTAPPKISEPFTAKQVNQYYIGAAFSFATFELDDIEQVSSNTGTPTQPKEEESGFNFHLTWGYKWAHWRSELDWEIVREFDYAPKPAITGAVTLRNLDSNLKMHLLFWNWIYDMTSYRHIHPYVGAGIGAMFSDIKATAINPGTGATTATFQDDKIRLIGNVQAGFRYRLSNHVWLDGAYQFIMGDSNEFGPVGVVHLEADSLTAHQFKLGLIYQF